MCGITGFFDLSRQMSMEKMKDTVRQMTNSLYHRGPDDYGFWVDPEVGLAFGHRRLSIVDLSPLGHQPMISYSGRFVIVFNGEIYNFRDIRRELETGLYGNVPYFRGHSDTEVMLAAIEAWGIEKAVKRFIGMFAFALWDREERLLYLGRDRLGEKPLYYGWTGRTFLFASEMKALRYHPDFRGEVDRNILALYLRFSYIQAPYCIYKGFYKLPAGTILTLDFSESISSPTPVSYWSVRDTAIAGNKAPFSGTTEEAIEELDRLLSDAVGKQMVADVPLGAFLSGGVDSSVVVALMQAQSKSPVKTFTIGFYEAEYNEAEYAKAVAKHLATDHTEFYVTSQQARDVIPKLPALYDEPFADSSQIPTYLVSALARQHVTVSLSGDGGDELFAGYNHYFVGQKIWNKIGWIPPPGRKILAWLLKSIPVGVWNSNFRCFENNFATSGMAGPVGDKIHKVAEIISVENADMLYRRLSSHWKQPEQVIFGSKEPESVLMEKMNGIKFPDYIHRMMFLDMVTYLPDDILVKVDRASMGVSLESRVPLLDHRVVEFAWQVPPSMKICDGRGKWLLRQVLYKYVPRDLIERPKKGFGVPIDSWLRGPLREWAEELLNERRLKEEGFFNSEPIREKWDEHQSGKRNWHYYLWDVLMFQAWLGQKL